MSTVQEIMNAIEQLPKKDFGELSEWVIRRYEDQWDRQIEQDVLAGKVKKLGKKAIEDLEAGRVRPFPE